MKKNVQTIIQMIDHIAPVPQVIHQLMELIDDPDATLKEIAQLIMYDPLLTANLFKTVNSSYFGLVRKVDSVNDAVLLLGMDQVVEIVLMQGASSRLKKACQGYGLAEGLLWKEAVASALLAKSIAKQIDLPSVHLVFTAALLKDIGKVVMNRFVASAISEIQAKIEDEGKNFCEAEQSVLGIDHAALGGMVAAKWHFSDKLAFIIKNHHLANPAAARDKETAVVYLADNICTMLGINTGTDADGYAFYDDILNELNLTEKITNEIMAEFSEKKEDIYGLLEVV